MGGQGDGYPLAMTEEQFDQLLKEVKQIGWILVFIALVLVADSPVWR